MRIIYIIFLLFALSIQAQKTEPPVNSNYLIDYGISPTLLDAALSTTLQNGSYSSDIRGYKIVNGDTISTEFKFIYDPDVNDGIDIQIVVDLDSLSKKEEKEIMKTMERTHSFSRLSRTELYDPNSLKLISMEGDNLELSFFYDKKILEPELKFGKSLKGLITVENGVLKSVFVTNFEKMKMHGRTIETGDFERTVIFKKEQEFGGYFVTATFDTYSFNDKKDKITIHYDSYVSSYKTTAGSYLETDENPLSNDLEYLNDSIKGSLGWVLPIFGKGAKKLGYKLPRPIGVNIFAHYQHQKMDFTELTVAVNDEEPIALGGLFDLPKSTVDQDALITMAKADVWLFPFLNVMGFYGSGTNGLNGALFINEDLLDFLEGIGVDPSQLPDRIPVESELSATIVGFGGTIAGGIGNFNASVNYQFMLSSLAEVNTSKVAHVISPFLGYMTPNGMNIMVGAQGQFYETASVGFIDLPDGDRLNYNVNFEPQVWNYLVGLYTPLSDHFELAVQGGFGGRQSLTVVFGYRF
ncbi:hypothetical protein [Lutimonas sp.]|uniref:hypothetical protein n=1 Tax=Lutimonas sp. TaxID=1872403 RepID=UPI003D9B5563